MKTKIATTSVAAATMMAGTMIPASAATSGGSVINVGTTALVSSTPLFLAEGLGYWKQLGLNVKLNITADAGTIDVSTAANSLDVSATGITASLFNLWNSGKKEYIVADKGRIWPGQKFEALVVSDKAWKSGVHSLSALKGKSFGNTSVGSTFDYLLGTMLQKAKLKLSDIKDMPFHAVPNMVSAVESGQVDAAILPQPAANAALSSHKVHLLKWVDQNVKADLLVVAYSPKFVQDTSDGTKFMEGYLEAVRYYNQYVYHSHNQKSPQLQKALKIISSYTKQPANLVESELIYVAPNGRVDPANIENQLHFYVNNGFVGQNIDVNAMVDNSFLRAATKALR